VILTSSEHSFPYRLCHERLHFNTTDVTELLFAGEIPPDKMYELLTTQWGVRHNLAVALIDLYGGHIYDISTHLNELNKHKGTYIPGSQRQFDDVLNCLKLNGDKKRMRELLAQIAENGFAPINDKTDPVAEFISRHNVGGLVQRRQATVIGFPDDVWGEHKIGLIPSKQSIRLVIAEVLEMHPLPWWRKT
jgi:hypothetical protein